MSAGQFQLRTISSHTRAQLIDIIRYEVLLPKRAFVNFVMVLTPNNGVELVQDCVVSQVVLEQLVKMKDRIL